MKKSKILIASLIISVLLIPVFVYAIDLPAMKTKSNFYPNYKLTYNFPDPSTIDTQPVYQLFKVGQVPVGYDCEEQSFKVGFYSYYKCWKA